MATKALFWVTLWPDKKKKVLLGDSLASVPIRLFCQVRVQTSLVTLLIVLIPFLQQFYIKIGIYFLSVFQKVYIFLFVRNRDKSSFSFSHVLTIKKAPIS